MLFFAGLLLFCCLLLGDSGKGVFDNAVYVGGKGGIELPVVLEGCRADEFESALVAENDLLEVRALCEGRGVDHLDGIRKDDGRDGFVIVEGFLVDLSDSVGNRDSGLVPVVSDQDISVGFIDGFFFDSVLFVDVLFVDVLFAGFFFNGFFFRLGIFRVGADIVGFFRGYVSGFCG